MKVLFLAVPALLLGACVNNDDLAEGGGITAVRSACPMVAVPNATGDITIFDPRRVRDRATFEQPNQYAEGINYVIINGQLAVDAGARTPALAGRVLRGPGYRPERKK